MRAVEPGEVPVATGSGTKQVKKVRVVMMDPDGVYENQEQLLEWLGNEKFQLEVFREDGRSMVITRESSHQLASFMGW